jgi:hypothetical protein
MDKRADDAGKQSQNQEGKKLRAVLKQFVVKPLCAVLCGAQRV